ncbi:MAG: M61 family metallopeptidase [Acidobacteria bacterium]|nr:M61 family metallopeptidase [Acidobacteriota bacterium]
MVRRRSLLVLLLIFGGATAFPQQAPAPVAYRVSFPEPEHRWMQVDITFPNLPPEPLQLRMSRSSPGRYALHEFAKNVFDVRATDAGGRPLAVTRPNPHQWDVTGHGGTARVAYRIFGDRVDGTYLGIDSTHAHINMPAAVMWARGLDDRPVTIRFQAPTGTAWRAATQLLPGADAMTFTAPNLQYLMDSPTELSDFSVRTFSAADVPNPPTFRLAVHHTGTDAELDAFAADVERVVREARLVFGEYPAFEGNAYTFIADYLLWASGDAMEHRNSTILTSASSIRANRLGLLGSVSHEFFHAWNAERIRPRSLEPFNFEEANMSGELWFAEGFTNYYEPLVLVRAGVTGVGDFAQGMAATINTVVLGPGRGLRSAEEMSQLAPFVDAATSIDRTSFDNTFISYYTFGEAIALGLDLTLRDRTDSRVTLDDYMRALWQTHGRPGGRRPGYVDNAYTMADLRSALAAVSGDAAFAADFFSRYIQGREAVDYRRLLGLAGLVLRPQAPGQAFAGELRLQDAQGRTRVAGAVPFGSPAYQAGLERDDIIISIGGTPVGSAGDVDRSIRQRRPGDTLPIVFERRGQRVDGTLRLVEDPRMALVPVEEAGQALTAAQRRFRDSWLRSSGSSP